MLYKTFVVDDDDDDDDDDKKTLDDKHYVVSQFGSLVAPYKSNLMH